MHPVGFSAFNCLLDSQCSLLTSQILGSCSKLKWSNRAYAVYWLRGTLLYPCIVGKMVVDNLTNTSALWHKGGHFKKKLSENVQL